jgi:hypothetical protein
MSKPYTHTVVQTEAGWHYVISKGDREVLRSGAFYLRSDADRVGDHFASDPDLEATFNRK